VPPAAWGGRRSVAVAGREEKKMTRVGVLRDKREEKKMTRVLRVLQPQGVFIPPKSKERRRILPAQIGRLRMGAASSGCWASFRTRQAARAGCFGSPPVGSRAASPGGVERRPWANFLAAG
jgi:hypothetical protein